MSETIQSFRDLRVYMASLELQQQVFETTKRFPKEETYALTDQFRRASRSVGANIAEAWQKRRYVAHFVNKLTDSDGEQAETQHWIATSLACGYISRKSHDDLMEKCCRIGGMLGSMLAKPERFCKTD
jgi:four helix bundle protein